MSYVGGFRCLFISINNLLKLWPLWWQQASPRLGRMLEEGRFCFFNWVYLRVFNLDVYKMLCKRGINHKK